MIKTLIMLGLVCLLAIFMMMDFIIVIPKFGSKHFGAFIRFFIITEGYKLFDIIFFDYLMLTKLKLPAKIYPETAGAKGYDNFGFNTKSQMNKLIIFCVASILLAFILTVIIPLM